MIRWIRQPRIRLLLTLSSTMLAAFTIVRCLLLIYSLTVTDGFDVSIADTIAIFCAGLINDLLFLTYASLLPGCYILLAPARFFARPGHHYFMLLVYAALVTGLAIEGMAEFLFWDEFSARFNFIAVDYLVYRSEVTDNILESYPVPLLLSMAVVFGMLCSALIYRLNMMSFDCTVRISSRLTGFIGLLMVALTCALTITEPVHATDQNRYIRELGLNGAYQFFHAFNTNELDYRENYLTIDDGQAARRLRGLIHADESINADNYSVSHAVTYLEEAINRNVFLVVLESMSTKYIGYHGSELGLTPNLDRISTSSLRFERFYATGTRTIRGLEAITLSVPPTPGRSIVKRPDNANLFNISTVFNTRGYETTFIYGGFGYFDNMNAFFGGNGFKVVDRMNFADEDVTFSNAWGVADEDLYRKAMAEADRSHIAKKPFFSLLMTTSNHRPFTYPAGRIEIPSGSSRYGAVKYADYAIGKFLDEAATHDWFDNTLFVFVADHAASSAGRVDLDVSRYHIPLLIYAPGIIKPAAVHALSSQIDLAPTLLSLLHFDYESRFFGEDILGMHSEDERAPIGNYQKLGLLHADSLAILSPNLDAQWIQSPLGDYQVEHPAVNDSRLEEVISWYQGADYVYRHGLTRLTPRPQRQPIDSLAQNQN